MRIRNFDEVFISWTEDQVRAEAARCLRCPDAPCTDACPLRTDIPGVLERVEAGDFPGAARTLTEGNNLPEICCRVCPQRMVCQSGCPHLEAGNLPVAIGHINTFLGDAHSESAVWRRTTASGTGHRVAVVGSGPAGMTVAELLAREGHRITVFEQWPQGGGSLRYGLPRFRLDHTRIQNRLHYLHDCGVEFVFDIRIGDGPGVDDLLSDGFEAVFLGTGAGEPAPVEIPGSELRGVLQAGPFLVQANVEQNFRPSKLEDPPILGRRVLVVGAGDRASDCSRTALRLGAAEVTWYLPESREDPSGDPALRSLAREEGVALAWQWEPLRILGDDRGLVRGVRFRRPEALSRGIAPGPAAGEKAAVETEVDTESVILVSGSRPDPALALSTPGLAVSEEGLLRVDPDTGRTTRDRVWAGGGNACESLLVASVVAQGRAAARDIHSFLAG